MLNAVFALAARNTITKETLDQWSASASRPGLSAITAPWLAFLMSLFVDNTIHVEEALRDTSRAWYWQAAASIKVAIDTAVRPAELLTVHHCWTQLLPQMRAQLMVVPDIEHLVTNAWRRLSENRFLLRAPALTVPVLQQACASASTGWQKIGEVLTAACDVVPATVPSAFRHRFQELK